MNATGHTLAHGNRIAADHRGARVVGRIDYLTDTHATLTDQDSGDCLRVRLDSPTLEWLP